MADLYAFIPEKVVVRVGLLPEAAVRLDTGQTVYDLNGSNIGWARACGWFDIDHPEALDDLGLTAEERDQIVTDVQAAIARLGRRQDAVQQVRDAAGIAKDFAYDWLDLYSSVPIEGSPNAGYAWGPLTANQKAEVLRTANTRLAQWAIRTADAQILLMDVLGELIDGTDVEPPTSP